MLASLAGAFWLINLRKGIVHVLGVRITDNGKRSMWRLLAASGLLLCAKLAMADSPPFLPKFWDGNTFFANCRADPIPGECLGYIRGASDGLSAASVLLKSCLYAQPSNATDEQVNDILNQYLREHPEKRNLDAAILLLAAMMEAYPCSK